MLPIGFTGHLGKPPRLQPPVLLRTGYYQGAPNVPQLLRT